MKAQQLKNSILQYAMQGKLVPQNSNDEPARVLLERIKEEKEQLIKEKVMKRENASTPILDDEIAYEIPDSWEWVRLGEIIKVTSGKNLTKKEMYEDGFYPVYGGNGITGRYNEFNTENDTLIIGRVGYYCGSVHLSQTKSWVTDNAFKVDFSTHNIDINWLKLILTQSNLKQTESSTAQPVISGRKIYPILVPIPPLSEQKRIIKKVEEVFPKVDKYDVLEEEITALNTSFPTDMEKSILQYAMQGKLVEQDANDESASMLLEKIEEERGQLIKDKVIKREKALAPITDDEIPFEIPNSWQWVRLNEISNIGQFKSIKGTIIEDDEWVLDLEEIEKESGILLEKVMKSQKSVLSNKYIFSQGNVLYGKLRPYLNKVIVADQCGYCTMEILPLDFGSYIFSNYAKHVLMSPYFLGYVNSCSYGVKMPRLGTADAKNALFPLPPLAEQKRIVAKIEEMQELTSKMTNAIRLTSSPK